MNAPWENMLEAQIASLAPAIEKLKRGEASPQQKVMARALRLIINCIGLPHETDEKSIALAARVIADLDQLCDWGEVPESVYR